MERARTSGIDLHTPYHVMDNSTGDVARNHYHLTPQDVALWSTHNEQWVVAIVNYGA